MRGATPVVHGRPAAACAGLRLMLDGVGGVGLSGEVDADQPVSQRLPARRGVCGLSLYLKCMDVQRNRSAAQVVAGLPSSESGT